MKTYPFYSHWVFEFRAGLREKSLLLMNYLFPMIFFVLMAALMGGINPLFKETMIPAMIVFAVLCSYLLAMPSSMVAARESGLYRSYRINGVPSWAGMAAPMLANAVHMVFVSAIIAIVGVLVFDGRAPTEWARFALGWCCLVGAMAGIGLLVSVVAETTRAATLLAQLIYIPSIVLGGLMTPPDMLPSALSRVAAIFPATHAMRVFRGSDGWWVSALALALSAVAAAIVSLALYEWDTKNVRPKRRKLMALIPILPFAITIFIG